MRCPNCQSHVTPFGPWLCRFRDAPGECPECGAALRPSWRTALLFPVVLPASMAAVVGALLLADRLLPDEVFTLVAWPVAAVAGLTVLCLIYYPAWATGRYEIDKERQAAPSAAAEGERTRPCPRCGKAISTYARACVHCKSILS